MTNWIRRLRGAVGIGLTWAAAWFGVGLVLMLVFGITADVPFPIFFGMLGFLGGVIFSGVLGMIGGRLRFEQISMPRFAAWGGFGGLLLAAGMSALQGWDTFPLLGPLFSGAGAVCAAGSLSLARMAEDQDLLEVGPEVDEVGLSADESRDLLGP